jgi:hypothetical protein
MHAENAAVLAHGAEAGPPLLAETPAEKIRNARQIVRGIQGVVTQAIRDERIHPAHGDPVDVRGDLTALDRLLKETHEQLEASTLPRYAIVRHGQDGEQLAILERAAGIAGEYFGRKFLRDSGRWTRTQRHFAAPAVLRDATAADLRMYGATEPPAL